MTPRADVAALVAGLLAVTVAAVGLWAAYGTISWATVATAAPVLLIVIGVIGLLASRHRS